MKINEEYPELLYEKVRGYDLKDIIKAFSSKEDLIFLNSSMLMEEHGKHSFICFDAFASFTSKGNRFFWNNTKVDIQDPFDFINAKVEEYRTKKNEQLPPLQGGIVGYWGYEASHYLEKLPFTKDTIKLPDIYLNFYSSIIVIDHLSNQTWITSTGFPEKNEKNRIRNAKKDIEQIKKILLESNKKISSKNYINKPIRTIESNFTKESYIKAIKEMKNYILNGDIFEANLTQQFHTSLSNDWNPLALYWQLMKLNPAPYSAFIKIPKNGYIISASPERFVKATDNNVETYPIKGTRKRSIDLKEDKRLMEALLASEKDHAENIMIVDLMRNDFSKVCKPRSISVEELCALKSYKTVHHLVSKITGQLKKNKNCIDLLRATFPPGSVTGAPKIRAMEIISELEKNARGPYCGCIGYISFTGDMDTSVTIRTYYINKKEIFFSAGGAIVLDSDPEEEYFESITKVKALMEALFL